MFVFFFSFGVGGGGDVGSCGVAMGSEEAGSFTSFLRLEVLGR